MPRYLTLSCIRHAEAQSNVQHEFNVNPDPLTDNGRKQAYSLARRWADVPIDILYSSDLERAKDTASILADFNTSSPNHHVLFALEEQRHGKAVEQAPSHMIQKLITGRSKWDKEMLPVRTHRPPMGGESLEDVRERAKSVLGGLVRKYGLDMDEPPVEFEGRYLNSRERAIPSGIPHVVIVSHNIFLSELHEVLQDWDTHHWSNCHFNNTAWCV
ncbi:phosphoglycerate mutase-like protein [Sistotremastrum suecicum HHB10207 ss-3]|uniref:Phosphoglycerate mutase-like protein n=1 Tax=Sistotremastrum suecicum HHB10207 ss-3 TaxID=1314776 RepID=A0A166B377_9AGAM|nr:phosphoglycerate mutase-like protein [Sistotremastrum suecicum HHB10207 ss-3]